MKMSQYWSIVATIHNYIIAWFLIWPALQGHRGQYLIRIMKPVKFLAASGELWQWCGVRHRRPSSSSVSKAYFLTAGAISMKLGVKIHLGNTPRAFFDFRDITYFVASRQPSWKSDFCHLGANGCVKVAQIFMGGVSNKTTSHNMTSVILKSRSNTKPGYIT
jgi:hypothetical protein